MKRFLIAAALCCIPIIRADNVTLSRQQATELYISLGTAEAGFSPANTIAAADNLNALRPHVEALDKGKAAYNRAERALLKAAPPDAEAQGEKLATELEAKANEAITVALVPLNLTEDELAAAKVKPAALSVIRRWLLKPAAPPPKK